MNPVDTSAQLEVGARYDMLVLHRMAPLWETASLNLLEGAAVAHLGGAGTVTQLSLVMEMGQDRKGILLQVELIHAMLISE